VDFVVFKFEKASASIFELNRKIEFELNGLGGKARWAIR
jgi:hypothetical protein